ncbi:MAG: insulinase family protein [Clostridia bacterium]|nr:insulinase family protein [Clostridia bacterium]
MKTTDLAVLQNLDLHAITTDKFKTNVVSVKFIKPINKKNASLLSLLSRVIKRGCEKYPTIAALSSESQRLYALVPQIRTFKSGSCLILEFSVDYLDSGFAPDDCDIEGGAFDILEQLIFHPLLSDGTFKEEYVVSEKAMQIDLIKSRKNNKSVYALKRMMQEMMQNDYRCVDALGDTEILKDITKENLTAAYFDLIKNSLASVYFVGRTDPQVIKDRIYKIFSGRVPHSDIDTGTKAFSGTGTGIKEITESAPVRQGKLCIGFTLGKTLTDGSFVPFDVMNELYGGGIQSKLFCNIREKMSLCYYCSSALFSATGIMAVSSGIECGKKDTVCKAIFAELEKIKNGEFSDEELYFAKLSLINTVKESFDSALALENTYFLCNLYSKSLDLDIRVKNIQNVTRNDVIYAAKCTKPDTVFFLKSDGEDDCDGNGEVLSDEQME